MILSTCGARAVVFHTTSFVCRAACARRTNHHGAVVASTTAGPACRRILRRVHMGVSSPVNVVRAAIGQPLSSHLRSPSYVPTIKCELRTSIFGGRRTSGSLRRYDSALLLT